MTEQEPNKFVTGRFGAHLKALAAAGKDPAKFHEMLVALREDTNLAPLQRDAILRMIAQECAISYIEIASGERPKPPPPPKE